MDGVWKAFPFAKYLDGTRPAELDLIKDTGNVRRKLTRADIQKDLVKCSHSGYVKKNGRVVELSCSGRCLHGN